MFLKSKNNITSLGVLSNSSATPFCLPGSIELNISQRSPSMMLWNDQKDTYNTIEIIKGTTNVVHLQL